MEPWWTCPETLAGVAQKMKTISLQPVEVNRLVSVSPLFAHLTPPTPTSPPHAPPPSGATLHLRDYQVESVDAVWHFMRTKTGAPVIELPTGAGKGYVLAELTRQAVTLWGGRVLVLQHVKELVEQNAEKLQKLCPTIEIGLYSAGLKRREKDAQVVVAGIQSVYDKGTELGDFDLIVIDEVHLYPESGTGMYRQLIAALRRGNPDVPVVGLTATPYRTGTGPICSPGGLFTEICYSVSVKTLIKKGYLSHLIGRRAVTEIDVGGLAVRRGEYDDAEVEGRMMATGVVGQAASELLKQCRDRRHVMVFCQTVSHAKSVAGWLRFGVLGHDAAVCEELLPATAGEHAASSDLGPEPLAAPMLADVADWLESEGHPTTNLRRYLAAGDAAIGQVYGNTPEADRAVIIKEFKAGTRKYMVNVNVLTTGFDSPNVDCVAVMRATMSPGLLLQMVGRGFRTHPDKANCLVLDFGRNFERHGPVDDIRPQPKVKGNEKAVTQRMCPVCRAVVAASVTTCPGCLHFWVAETRAPNHEGQADGEPLGCRAVDTIRAVGRTEYHVHVKKGGTSTDPRTLKVTYEYGFNEYISEWVCIEHPAGGFAHQKAAKWWAARCALPMPDTADEAVQLARTGMVGSSREIVVRISGKDTFPEIAKHFLDPIPYSVQAPTPPTQPPLFDLLKKIEEINEPKEVEEEEETPF